MVFLVYPAAEVKELLQFKAQANGHQEELEAVWQEQRSLYEKEVQQAQANEQDRETEMLQAWAKLKEKETAWKEKEAAWKEQKEDYEYRKWLEKWGSRSSC